jgi:AraC family transcriptional regulator
VARNEPAVTPSPVTLGRVVNRAGVGDAVVTETAHPAGLRLPWHRHGPATLTLTLAGRFAESIGPRRIAVGPGTVLLKPAGAFHADRYHSVETRCLVLAVTPGSAERISRLEPVLRQVWVRRGGPVAMAMQELSSELRRGAGASSLILEGAVWRALGFLAREVDRNASPGWLETVEEFLRRNAHRRLTLREVAAVAAVHPGHLTREFRRRLGMSIGHYVRHQRIERAIRLLVASRDSLGGIAASTGFADQSHFARVFKTHTGVTPSDYRRSARRAFWNAPTILAPRVPRPVRWPDPLEER